MRDPDVAERAARIVGKAVDGGVGGEPRRKGLRERVAERDDGHPVPLGHAEREGQGVARPGGIGPGGPPRRGLRGKVAVARRDAGDRIVRVAARVVEDHPVKLHLDHGSQADRRPADGVARGGVPPGGKTRHPRSEIVLPALRMGGVRERERSASRPGQGMGHRRDGRVPRRRGLCAPRPTRDGNGDQDRDDHHARRRQLPDRIVQYPPLPIALFPRSLHPAFPFLSCFFGGGRGVSPPCSPRFPFSTIMKKSGRRKTPTFRGIFVF